MSNDWKQSTCACMDDCEICMCGWCCGSCLAYRNAEDLNKSGILCCLAYCIMPFVPLMLLRGEAREKYGIEGSVAGDFGKSFCCSPCTNCQTAAEIKHRGDHN